ncbi:carboxypeptidase-like regulatory domain-containing protein [Lutibacter sp.]|uniref:TonB-dependent receptor n=1 Tax=Lutibacter sp. TaxID=1925666 RepID=UPI003562B84F
MNQKILTFLFVFFISGVIFAQGGIKGTVVDESGEAISQAEVFIKITNQGTITNNKGEFELNNVKNGTYSVSVIFIGYVTVEKSVTISDSTINLGLITLNSSYQVFEEVVVSGSRKLEKITEAPVTINVISARQLDNFVGDPSELIAQQKGIDFIKTGAFVSGFNIRGFNSAFNPKMLQLDDNRFSTLIATGLPFGPLTSVIKEDIERVEIVLGPSSALYGPNAHNGLVNTITKSPWKYEGTEIALGGGSYDALSARLRHAKKLSEKWAYKVTAGYAEGTDVNWTDSVYVGGIAKPELELDRKSKFFKSETSVFYKPTTDSEIKAIYGTSKSSYLAVTNVGRNQIKDWGIQFLQGTYTSKHFFANLYKTWSSTDDTYAITTRTENYWGLIAAGETHEDALVNSYGGNNPPIFVDKSDRLNAEIQYNNSIGGVDYIIGAQYQKDKADSRDTYLIDATGPIEIEQKGFYGQLEYKFGESGVKLIAAARGDDHDLYGFNFIPKAGITYTMDKGTWRFTYGKGIASPTILNLSGDLFGGIILGNGVGFTLSDGSEVAPVEVETIQTLELGYKGYLSEGKLFLDANAYYNMSENFLSPLTNIVPTGLSGGPVVTHRGDQPIDELTVGLAPGFYDAGGYVLTYLNFGKVDTYGFDLGLTYYFNEYYNMTLNYSFFDYNMDKNDMANDGDKNGVVNVLDLPINTPKNKISSAFNFSRDKFYGSILSRYIQKYDFFSGRNVAAKTNADLIIGGDPVVEGQRVGKKFNYGQLGGFFLSVNLGYKISDHFSLGAYVNNILDTNNYEFVASPPSERTYGVELKIKL